MLGFFFCGIRLTSPLPIVKLPPLYHRTGVLLLRHEAGAGRVGVREAHKAELCRSRGSKREEEEEEGCITPSPEGEGSQYAAPAVL